VLKRGLTRAAAALALVATLAAVAAMTPVAAQAAGPPQIAAAWTSEVSAASASFHGEIDPEGLTTHYRFEYETEAAWQANPPSERFKGAAKAPSGSEALLGTTPGFTAGYYLAAQHVSALKSAATYRYRLSATSSEGTETLEANGAGAPLAFTTQAPGAAFSLPDNRGWELVSPPDKNGGGVQGPEQNHGGGTIQAAATGAGAITYSSSASFGGTEAQGAPLASQYISRRSASGWSTQNITAPTVSGSYGSDPNGVPYQLFSTDLARGLMQNGLRCPEPGPCPRPYSLWEGGAFTPLPAQAAGMRVLGASPDLGRILFEDEGGEAYEWSGGAALVPIAPPAPPDPGVLGASADGQTVYLQDATGLKRRREATTTTILAGPEAAQPSDYPAATGTSRVSADGETLLFLSKEPLSGYDNHDATTGQPDSELFLYEAGAGGALRCLSCNPTGERPLGPSTIPGAYANGKAEGSTDVYKPRNLAVTANRAFFNSEDALVALDTNKAPDAYQWEAQGTGSCQKPGGCLSLLSSGTGEGASFLDASESGEDAFLLTAVSLQPPVGRAVSPEGNVDPGSADVYDARAGGGFAEPGKPIPCEGDACAPLPNPPEDPTVGTLIPGTANPPVHFPKTGCPKGKKQVTRHGKTSCVGTHKPKHHRRGHK
jgi:hypothetical protein